MRELARSFSSFSWALSLLGVQQALEFVRGPLGAGQGSPAPGLGRVTRVAEGQLGATLRTAFEAGARVQSSAIDLAFGVMTLEALDPNRFVALSSDLARQSTTALRSLIPGGEPAAGGSGCGQPCGWGPMPPAR